MDVLMNGLLLAATLFAGGYCWVLAGRVRELHYAPGETADEGALLASLDALVPHTGPRVVYGESSRLSPARLKALGITFRQIPYDIRAR